MFSWLGWTFRVQAQDVDESPLPGEHPSRYVCRLAYEKAVSARKFAQPAEWVVAADTIVADGPTLLGKPQDQAEARSMLVQLRGRVHQVYTALSSLWEKASRSRICAAKMLPCAIIPAMKWMHTLPAVTRWIKPALTPFSMLVSGRLIRSMVVLPASWACLCATWHVL